MKKMEQFVITAIKTLRKDGRMGIHVVYSKFNAAFRAKFNTDPQPVTKAMELAGKIVVQPCRGGAMLYLAGEQPEDATSKALAAINAAL